MVNKAKKAKAKARKRPRPGVCRVCGCTDDCACDGGCYWVDRRCTLCSNCAPDAEFPRAIPGVAHA
jgi:hypothetical protein